MSVLFLELPETFGLPPRSRLYSLPAQGLGTGLVESLTSYITRLADAHCLPVWLLVCREIAPVFSSEMVTRKNGTSDLFKSLGSAINGNTATATQMAKVVSQLTGVPYDNLVKLTLAPCGEFLAKKPLLSKLQKWCPHCLETARTNEQAIIYPLLWQLECVEICPIHNSLLENNCPHCDAHQTPLMRNVRVGCCGKCDGWLGSKSKAEHTAITDWQQHTAQQSLEFLHHGRSSDTGIHTFEENLSTILRYLFDGNVSAFARSVETNMGTIAAWMRQKQRPSLPSLLLLSYVFNVPAHTLFAGQITASMLSDPRVLPSEAVRMVRPTLERHDLDGVKEALEEAIATHPYPPPSLKKICRSFGVNQSFVMRKMPELAAKVRDHYRFFLKTRKEIAEFYMKMEIQSKVTELYAAGLYPSSDRVEARLSGGLSLRNALARATWRDAVKELGFPEIPEASFPEPETAGIGEPQAAKQ